MDIEKFRQICLAYDDVSEEFPFGPDTLVYKVRGKMFALTDLLEFTSINVKCDPEEAIDLRERYPAVQPGYHMNKNHWNTVLIDNSISDSTLEKWIRQSYLLVLATIPRSRK